MADGLPSVGFRLSPLEPTAKYLNRATSRSSLVEHAPYDCFYSRRCIFETNGLDSLFFSLSIMSFVFKRSYSMLQLLRSAINIRLMLIAKSCRSVTLNPKLYELRLRMMDYRMCQEALDHERVRHSETEKNLNSACDANTRLKRAISKTPFQLISPELMFGHEANNSGIQRLQHLDEVATKTVTTRAEKQ